MFKQSMKKNVRGFFILAALALFVALPVLAQAGFVVSNTGGGVLEGEYVVSAVDGWTVQDLIVPNDAFYVITRARTITNKSVPPPLFNYTSSSYSLMLHEDAGGQPVFAGTVLGTTAVSNVTFDIPTTIVATTPVVLNPGATYYVGFRSNNVGGGSVAVAASGVAASGSGFTSNNFRFSASEVNPGTWFKSTSYFPYIELVVTRLANEAAVEEFLASWGGDGRLNLGYGDNSAAVYPGTDATGNASMNVYCSAGYYAFSVTAADIAAIGNPPAVNTLIKEEASCGVAAYLLTTGEVQFNIREYTGKEFVIIFSGLGGSVTNKYIIE